MASELDFWEGFFVREVVQLLWMKSEQGHGALAVAGGFGGLWLPKSPGLTSPWREAGCCAWRVFLVSHVLSLQDPSSVPRLDWYQAVCLENPSWPLTCCAVLPHYMEKLTEQNAVFFPDSPWKSYPFFSGKLAAGRDAECQAVWGRYSPEIYTSSITPIHRTLNTLCNCWPWSGSKLS